MCALKIQLRRDEEVVFETERAVLTSNRLLVNLDRKNREVVTDDVPLSSIADFKKDSRGEESRFGTGIKLMGAGFFVVTLQLLLPDLPFILGGGLFMTSAILVIMGFYLIINRGVLRVKPSTWVTFTVLGSRDVTVFFPGRENPGADELTRHYVRTKRDLSIN